MGMRLRMGLLHILIDMIDVLLVLGGGYHGVDSYEYVSCLLSIDGCCVAITHAIAL